MTTDHEIEEALQKLRFTTSPTQDKRILADALTTVVEKSETGTINEVSMHSPNRQAVPHPKSKGRTLLKRTRNTRRLIASAVVTMVILIGVLLWFGRPSDTWADVVEAVRAKPWIYVTAKTPDGKNLSLGCPCHGMFLPVVTAKISHLRTIACGFSISTTRRTRCFIACPIPQGLRGRVS